MSVFSFTFFLFIRFIIELYILNQDLINHSKYPTPVSVDLKIRRLRLAQEYWVKCKIDHLVPESSKGNTCFAGLSSLLGA